VAKYILFEIVNLNDVIITVVSLHILNDLFYFIGFVFLFFNICISYIGMSRVM